MRFIRAVLLGLAGLVPFAACGLSTEGTASVDPDGGGGVSGSGGSGGVGGTQCFPGSKVCPNAQGEPECLASSAPETGCATSSCEPCTLTNATAKCGADGKCAIDQCSPGFADCDDDPKNGCESNLQWAPDKCGTCQTNCTNSGRICEEGTCVVDTCPSGTANCNGDKSTCEVDTTSDPNNCGFCTNQCNLLNANSACAASKCVITSCAGAYRDCDQEPATGCEVNSATDADNCGQCGKKCSSTNGVPGCNNGNCVIVCTPPFANCDNNADNGCEVNLHTTLAHCGACNVPCQLQNVNGAKCVGGACDYDSCQTGWGDCDGNRANGCERNLQNSKNHCGTCNNVCQDPRGGTSVCSNGACASSCSPPQTLCTSTCFNLTSDVSNCGSCGNVCTTTKPNATASCSGGACGFTCNGGFTNCGGDCVNVQNTVAHCGACSNGCPTPQNGTPTCSGGQCGFNCNTGFTKCGNLCLNLSNNVDNCGSCGNPCPGPASGSTGQRVCSGGNCSFSCSSGTLCSPGSPTGCWNTGTSNLHCGGCDQPCTGQNRSCVGGNCVCTGGTTECGGACVNTATNASHCGSCGNACPAGTPPGTPTCSGSTCGLSCSSGTACPQGAPTGCFDTTTDKNNCGGCGNVCGGTAHCAASACTCTDPQIYCGGQCVNKNTDADNCGKCGCKCSSPPNCNGGTCQGSSSGC
ncbi:MAG: hypothetical protein KF718_13775 [Polyangiaceae bacterium]|nr:hypothetical protein [Polyangiaceae bacterium]